MMLNQLNGQCNQGYYWAVWNSFTGNSATGIVSPPSGDISVTMSANYNFDSTPTIFGYAAFNGFGGNAPPNATVPRTTWAVGQGGETTMCFSETVTNPVLLLASLGSPSIVVTLNFSRAYQVVYDGGGMTYPNDLTVVGQEGYAIIVFPGAFDCVTIFSNTPENWTNITWGLSPHLFEVEITGDPSGCGEATVTASGGDLYSWSGGENPQEATNTFTQSGTYFVTVTDSQGCTVVTSVDIDIYPSETNWIEEQICQGETYFFNGQPIETEGFYSAMFTNQFGCDSLVNLNLQVLPISNEEFTAYICEGESFWFDNLPRTESGVYVQVLSNLYGCDSTTILNLEVLPHYELETEHSICEGESYLFNGQFLTQPGLYSTNFQTEFGCDSIVQLNLIVLSIDTTEVNEVICEGREFQFGNQRIDTPGRYEELFSSSFSCDSLVILNLEMLPNSSSNLEFGLCPNDYYLFQGDTIRLPGQYVATIQNSVGCDSTINLNILPLPEFSIFITQRICKGDSIAFEGRILSEPGIYIESYTTVSGCDSIFRFELIVLDTSVNMILTSICAGDSILFDNNYIKSAGQYSFISQNSEGCDSTIVLDLVVNPIINTEEFAQICAGQTYTWQGSALSVAGIYEQILTSVNGCDSILRLQLEVVTAITSAVQAEICEGRSFSFGGQLLTDAGFYTDTLISAGGCDSIVTLELRLIGPVNSTVEASICTGERYFFIDEWIDQPGSYQKRTTAQNGCDSIVRLNLIEYPTTETRISRQICEGTTFDFHGTVLSNPGQYQALLRSIHGCDSLIILELEVQDAIRNQLFANICEGENYNFNGRELLLPGAYTDTLISSGGCDSILLLELSVLPIIMTESSVRLCQGDYYIFGQDTLRISGDYRSTFRGQNGCDSIHTLRVAFIEADVLTDTIAICQDAFFWPVNGISYSSSGTYTARFENAIGCDSIHVLRLSLLPTYRFEETVNTRRSYDWPVNGVRYGTSGIYFANFTSTQGCDSIYILNLNIKDKVGVYAPNAFTPNSDGINDRFTIYGDEDLLRIESLNIYDRWGNQLAEYKDLPPNDPDFGWDGKKGSKALDPAVFIFTARLLLSEDEQMFIQGEVQLLR
jgi:gliding motility-associated-like protein